MQVVDSSGNVFGQGLEITDKNGKPKVPVINTDITIGTTAIVGGVSGRLLYDNAGVVGETNGAHWNTAGFLGIGTATPVAPVGYNGITINSATTGAYDWFQTSGITKYAIGSEGNINYHNLVAGTSFLIRSGGSNYFNVVQSTGNIQIGTTTDAGFKLDVNGTSRIQGVLTAAGNYIQYGTNPNVGIGSTNNGNSFVNNGPALLYASANISATQVYAHNFFTGSFNSTSGVQGLANLTGANFSPTSGTAVFNTINATPTINQTGGASGITRGLYINPTLTAAADFRAIETTAGSVIFNGPTTISNRYLYHQGASAIQYFMTSNAWSGTNSIFFGDDSSATIGSLSYNHQFDSFAITVNGNNRMQIASTGNVLIGTTTDAGFKLDVNGTARISGNITFGGTIGSGGSSNLIIAAGNASVEVQTTNPNLPTGSIITTGAITRTDSGVKSIINVNNAVTSTAANFNTLNGFAFTSTISQTLGTIRGIYIAPTLTASTDFRAIETTVGNVLFGTTSGNVGIGTTNPIYNLEVVSSTGYAGIGIRSAQNNNAELSFQNAGYSVPRWTIRASGAANGSSGSLVFQRNAATFPMVITSGDNVLIGTSIDSGYKLNVNGIGYFNSRVDLSANSPLTLGGSGNNQAGVSLWGTQNASNGWDGWIGRNLEYNGTNYIYKTTDANNLWGTVAGIRILGNGNLALGFIARPATGQGANVIATDLNTYTRLAILYNGNVGIGTTTPFGKFDVKDGEIFVTTSTDANLRSRLTYQGLYVSRASDGGYPENIISTSSAWLYNSRNAHTFFRDTIPLLTIGALSATAGININTNGNVLINSATDAGYKLDVNGNTRSNRFYATDGITLQRISFEGFNNQVGIDYNSTSGLFKFFASGNNFLSAGWNLDTIIAPVRNSSGGNFGDVVINVGGSERARFKNTGNLLINTTTDVASSQLTIESTTKGFLPPRMSNAQMLAIATPATSLMVYDTTNNKLCCYDGTTWQNLF